MFCKDPRVKRFVCIVRQQINIYSVIFNESIVNKWHIGSG